jgi:hypothetical protein
VNEYAATRPAPRNRERKRLFNGETARKALAGFGRGQETFGFTKGQFSSIDLIDAILDFTGEADGTIATWTAHAADIRRAEMFVKARRLRSLTWLVDYSFETRQPAFCELLRATFGDDCIRTAPIHAKFGLFKGDDWHVVMQTSMNLNQNPRLENFTVMDDQGFYLAFEGLVADLLEYQAPGAGFDEKPSVRKAEFARFGKAEKSDFYRVKSGADIV